MHPITLIEIMIASIFILLLLMVSVILRKKWRKNGLILTSVLLVITFAFFFIRPYWIDYQIKERIVVLDEYLKERYPGESWEISSIDHTTYRQYNPYHLHVTFSKELEIQYSYHVNWKGDIKQVSVYTPDNIRLSVLNYLEIEENQ
ncbi:hypothetical protein BC6307_14975 [Sutcliffiella cohnii]|uniref:Uncharacterized protein n=1 Tax=Sutcliffiella cohnii TaxID=33932 RepID=A0A223KSM5_9BACI|nr:DUF4118 domain-containing protein [Sutcliffiella cohnii]AST92501.1 hypothetical protein BC6307_14975 [Sutcliffiella cohnii]